MKDITLFIGYTSVAIKLNKFSKDVFYILRKFTFRLNDYVFDRKLKKFVRDKNYFLGVSSKGNQEQDVLVIPRNYLPELEVFLAEHNLTYDKDIVESIQTREINKSIALPWKPREDQLPAIEYLTTHNNPIRCLALQTGCLAADSKINFNDHEKIIEEAYHNKDLNLKVKSLNESDELQLNGIVDILYSGIKSIYRLSLANCKSIDCTKDHLIRTSEGWIEAQYCLGKLVRCNTNEKYSHAISFKYLKEGDTYDICCEDPHNSFTANDIVVHNCGKSFSSVFSAIQLNKPFLIITSGLVKQWYDNVVSQTDIPETDIYVIKGGESIRNIMENNLKPTAVIASLETIRNFAQNKKEYHDFEYSLQEVLKHLQIGTKIVDECHENFHGIVSIDLVVNVEVNIYLSATYIRNNQSTHKIFDVIFPPDNRFGEGNYDKYININMFEYSSFVPTKYVNIGGTYSHFNYEKYLLKHERGVHWFTHSLLKRIINDYYITKKKPGQRLLILMATLDNINKVVEQLRKIYPDLSILPFTAKDKEENLEADIIVSTIGSSGTGRDIPNLLTTILTVSIKAEGAVKQIVGRLRKLKDGSEVYFCDMFNEQSESQVRHKMVRSNLYLRIGKTYSERRI